MQILMKMTKKNINKLKQPGLTCQSICVTNKIWQVNLVQLFPESKMAANNMDSPRWVSVYKPFADFGDLWVIWYISLLLNSMEIL